VFRTSAPESSRCRGSTRYSRHRQAGVELEPPQVALLDREMCFDTVRPHQALGYLTPAEWLEPQGILVPGV
jgi:transposase InsO family protein